jgi:hypothetical protein
MKRTRQYFCVISKVSNNIFAWYRKCRIIFLRDIKSVEQYFCVVSKVSNNIFAWYKKCWTIFLRGIKSVEQYFCVISKVSNNIFAWYQKCRTIFLRDIKSVELNFANQLPDWKPVYAKKAWRLSHLSKRWFKKTQNFAENKVLLQEEFNLSNDDSSK